MYEIWLSEGSGTSKGPRFRLLHDAINYVKSYADPGSVAIRLPDGGWYRWDEDNTIVVRNRRRSRRIPSSAPCRVRLQEGEQPDQAPVDCWITDASATGLRLELSASLPAAADSPATVALGDGGAQFEVPALVRWSGPNSVGMELMIRDEFSRSRYRRWLDQTVG